MASWIRNERGGAYLSCDPSRQELFSDYNSAILNDPNTYGFICSDVSPIPPAPVNYFPSDEDVTEAQVIAYQQANLTPSPAVIPPLPAPVPLPTGITTAAPTTGAGETGTGRLPQCTNDMDGVTGYFAHTCQGKPSINLAPAQPATTGKTFWDVFSFENSKSKLWIALIAVGVFLIFSSKR